MHGLPAALGVVLVLQAVLDNLELQLTHGALALRIVLCEILGEYIVAGRSQTVATHTAVVLLLV